MLGGLSGFVFGYFRGGIRFLFSDGQQPRTRFFHRDLSGGLEVPGRGGGEIDPDRGADLAGEEEAGRLQPLGGALNCLIIT